VAVIGSQNCMSKRRAVTGMRGICITPILLIPTQLHFRQGSTLSRGSWPLSHRHRGSLTVLCLHLPSKGLYLVVSKRALGHSFLKRIPRVEKIICPCGFSRFSSLSQNIGNTGELIRRGFCDRSTGGASLFRISGGRDASNFSSLRLCTSFHLCGLESWNDIHSYVLVTPVLVFGFALYLYAVRGERDSRRCPVAATPPFWALC
jgi:hypothetical protein